MYSDVTSIRVRVPGFEPGISPPQGEVLTTILHTPGEAGYRSLYLSHAKRALYHLSYIPGYHTPTRTRNLCRLRITLTLPRFTTLTTTSCCIHTLASFVATLYKPLRSHSLGLHSMWSSTIPEPTDALNKMYEPEKINLK